VGVLDALGSWLTVDVSVPVALPDLLSEPVADWLAVEVCETDSPCDELGLAVDAALAVIEVLCDTVGATEAD